MKKAWKKLERKRLAPDSRIIEGNLVSWEECCDALSVGVHICVLCSGTRETIAKEYVLSSCLQNKNKVVSTGTGTKPPTYDWFVSLPRNPTGNTRLLGVKWRHE